MKIKIKVLNLVIILSILLFVISFYFKMTQKDNSERINVNPVKKSIITNNIKNSAIDDKKNQTSTTTENDSQLDKNNETHYYTNEETVENINNRLNKALMYNTPEKVIDAIDYYKKVGNFEKEKEFTDYLLQTFPDYNY